MADNYVEIKIKASDTAKPDLTELRADLDELGRKVETARVDVDDEEAKLKLLELNAKLAALNKKVANPRITVSSAARAESDIARINAEMDKLGQKAQQNGGKGGLLGKILFGAAGDAEGAASGAEGGLSSLASTVGRLGPAMLALVPAAAAALVEVTGLATGFAAAGAGAGAFALLAMPAFKKVGDAYTKIGTDQKAYDDALTQTAKNTALKKLQQDYKDLDPAERGAVKGLQSFSSEFGKISKAFEPTAFKIFNDGLKIANSLLPDVTPLAKDFGGALDGLLKHLDKFANSKGFKDWLKQFGKDVGPAVTAIGNGIGKLGPAFGKLLTAMSKKDVVNAINIAFGILVGTMNAVVFTVKRLMWAWDTTSSEFRKTRHAIASGAHAIAGDFDSMRHTIASWAHSTANAFDHARHTVADFAHNVAAHFDEARHTVATWAHNVASLFDSVRHTVASWGHDLAHDFDTVRHKIAQWVGDVGTDVGKAVSWFKGLPGRILSALGNLGSLLYNAGRNIIQGLINGISSMIGAVGSAIGHIAGEITSHLPFSPAKKGPLSGAGDPAKSGRKITQMLAEGMTSGLGSVTSASARVAGGAAIGAHGGAHGGAGGAGRIQLEFVGGDEPIVRALRQMIRVKGGDVQVVLGH